MKKVPKILIDSFLLSANRFWKYGGSSDPVFDMAKVLEKYTGVDWFSWKDLVDAILGGSLFGGSGFDQDFTNEKFYEILKILGVEVVDE